jgi:elongation factor G
MAVNITSQKEFVGDCISLVTQRGGMVSGMESKAMADESSGGGEGVISGGGEGVIKAEAPMEKMFGFMTSLRSVTQGRAGFSMQFSHFEKKAT